MAETVKKMRQNEFIFLDCRLESNWASYVIRFAVGAIRDVSLNYHKLFILFFFLKVQHFFRLNVKKILELVEQQPKELGYRWWEYEERRWYEEATKEKTKSLPGYPWMSWQVENPSLSQHIPENCDFPERFRESFCEDQIWMYTTRPTATNLLH